MSQESRTKKGEDGEREKETRSKRMTGDQENRHVQHAILGSVSHNTRLTRQDGCSHFQIPSEFTEEPGKLKNNNKLQIHAYG